MKNFLFLIYCESGGFGWGKAGQKGWMIATEETAILAENKVKNYIPGGWKCLFVKETNDAPGLVTNLPSVYFDTVDEGE